MIQPKQRYNYHAPEEIRETAIPAINRVREEMEEINRQKDNQIMSDKILRKRLRRMNNLCQDMIKYDPECQHYTRFRITLITEDDGSRFVKIYMNGNQNGPGQIIYVETIIPLSDLQAHIKRTAEAVRYARKKHMENIKQTILK